MKISRHTILIILMIVGEIIFLLPFVVARIFRPTFLKVFDLTNFELGSAFSVYGVFAMISYLVGGPIADRFSPRRLIAASLVITAMGGIFMAMIPSLVGLTILYAFWGMSTILLFWAAFIKATRVYGGDRTQGRAFGAVDAGRGLVSAVLASFSVLLFDAFLPVSADVAGPEDMSEALSRIIIVFSSLIALSAILVWWAFPKDDDNRSVTMDKLTIKGILAVASKRVFWYQAVIVMCAYVGYKCTDDFSLYASDVFGYNDVDAAHVGTVSFWVRPVAALAAGILGDRFQCSNMVMVCFGILIAGSLILSSGAYEPGLELYIILTIASTSLGIYGLRGLYFALFNEWRLPLIYTGSAVGLISVLGYSPDIFMGPLMGYVLDTWPGATGHQYLFALLAVFGAVGLIAAIAFRYHRTFDPKTMTPMRA